MQKLLTYYRSRTDIENPNLTATLNDTEQGYADYAIDEYRFYVNDNYLEDKDRKIPYSLKSNDQTINWQFAPEGADNEYQKQLHRHNWIPMQGKAYQKSKNEKYMLSWKEVYTDWILKNPKPNGQIPMAPAPNVHTYYGANRIFRVFQILLSFHSGMAFLFPHTFC